PHLPRHCLGRTYRTTLPVHHQRRASAPGRPRRDDRHRRTLSTWPADTVRPPPRPSRTPPQPIRVGTGPERNLRPALTLPSVLGQPPVPRNPHTRAHRNLLRWICPAVHHLGTRTQPTSLTECHHRGSTLGKNRQWNQPLLRDRIKFSQRGTPRATA